MSESDRVGVHTAELAALGSDYRRSADSVRQQAARVVDGVFGSDSSDAGRNYLQHAAAVHRGLERIGTWLRNWSDATAETADTLGVAVVAYEKTDRQRAARTNAL
ncbi:type VII secretion target [Nocardia sp. CNY236]|uniref:type VII secretion target n=1 Tax=Nocardia sp. CNY236 TaxID=1169152 RepID=UPI000414F0AF|nr:type VII secretion target [Nocardia sp. CNY236]